MKDDEVNVTVQASQNPKELCFIEKYFRFIYRNKKYVGLFTDSFYWTEFCTFIEKEVFLSIPTFTIIFYNESSNINRVFYLGYYEYLPYFKKDHSCIYRLWTNAAFHVSSEVGTGKYFFSNLKCWGKCNDNDTNTLHNMSGKN